MQPPPSQIPQLSKLPTTLNMKGIVREEKSEWEGTVVLTDHASDLFISLKKKKRIYLAIYFWLLWVFTAEAGLSLVAASRGCSLVPVHGLLVVVTSRVSEHKI